MPPTQARSPLAWHRFNLAAGATRTLDVTGSYLKIADGIARFDVRLDDGVKFPIEGGFSYRLKAGDSFRRIEFTNPGNNDIDVEFYAGSGSISNERLLYTREAPTFFHGYTVTVTLGTPVIVPRRPIGQHRKTLQLRALALSSVISYYRCNAAGTAVILPPVANNHPVFPTVLHTSDHVGIGNVQGTPVAVQVLETYFLP